MTSQRVTDVLKLAGLIDTSFYTDVARERGTVIHKAAQLVAENDFDESWLDEVDSVTRGRVSAFVRFTQEHHAKIVMCEFEVRHPLGFHGHPDLLVIMNDRSAVIDIKPPNEESWHPIQLSAYQNGIMRTYPSYGAPLRYNLYLSDNGTYKLKRRSDPGDWSVFRAALTIAQFKTEAKQ